MNEMTGAAVFLSGNQEAYSGGIGEFRSVFFIQRESR
jgi:hypothetical protein